VVTDYVVICCFGTEEYFDGKTTQPGLEPDSVAIFR
jgi:hypothetical protein